MGCLVQGWKVEKGGKVEDGRRAEGLWRAGREGWKRNGCRREVGLKVRSSEAPGSSEDRVEISNEGGGW